MNIHEAHEEEYGVKPDVVVETPGRFHLIGEHSWFFRDKTLSMAVNLPVYVAVSRSNDNSLHFYFHQTGNRKKSLLASLKFRKEDAWANSLKAMVYGYTSGGYEICGLNFTVYTDILPSAGLGINTAIKIGTTFAVNKLLDLNLSVPQLLQVIERGNKIYLGGDNYLADNFTAIFSEENSLILTDHSKHTCQTIPFNFEGKSVLIVDTKVPRFDSWNENLIREPENVLLLGELRETKKNVFGGWRYIDDPDEINIVLSVTKEETRHKLAGIIEEHKCLLEAVESLQKGLFGGFARAVNNSHVNMREAYDISCAEIDWILKRLLELHPNNEDARNPFSCGRITGKGFGRCLYAILDDDYMESFVEKLKEFKKIFGFDISYHLVKPSNGVRIVS